MKRLNPAYANYRPRITVYSGVFEDPVYGLTGSSIGVQWWVLLEPPFSRTWAPEVSVTIFSLN